MDLLYIALLVASCSVLLWWQMRRRARLPPGPFAWPIIGNLPLLFGGAPRHLVFQKLAHRYGPFVYLRLGSMPAVVVSSPELARQFLTTHDKVFASRPPIESAKRLNYGQEIAVATRPYGAGWRELRRLYALQLFTARKVNEFKPIMMEEINETVGEVRRAAEAGVPFDITKSIGLLVENIMCRILMGKRLHEVTSNVRLGKTLKQVVQEGTLLFGTPIIGDFIPYLRFVDRKTIRRMEAWRAVFDELIENVVTAHEKATPASALDESLHKDHKDFIDVLLSNHLSRDEVKGNILQLLGAGIDTSSTSVDWAMAELLMNPKAMNKMEEELKGLKAGCSSDSLVQEEDLPNLVYTKAVVKETMRLHAPIPLLLPHMSMEACEVAGFSLPKGTRLFVNAWGIGHDEQVWEGADTFWPDRFLGKCEQVDVRGKHFELLPFGAGRRSCPGIPLALPIIETTLANLVLFFHWSLPPPPNHVVDMSEKFGFMLSRARPLIAIPSLRTQH